jgi:cytochrome c-type biogenesis protein CcmH/NrfG
MLQDIEDRILVETVEQEPLSLPVEAGTPPELAEARQLMLAGSVEEALEKYSDLIFNKQSLEEVIYDLNQILVRHSDDTAVWQTLGDAQMRANHVQDALEAYTRAEQLF